MEPDATEPAVADQPWWSLPAVELLRRHASGTAGLASDEATRRRQRVGDNVLVEAPAATLWHLALRQFSSPLVLILVVGALISLFIGDWADAATILLIVAGSATLGLTQEVRASKAVAALHDRLALTSRVRRDGRTQKLPASELVPGDVVELSAGSLVPADGVVLEARDFLVIESSLTGESFPVEKQPGVSAVDASVGARTNCVFLGSSVRSGTAVAMIVGTGRDTALGEMAARLALRPPETEFARGVRQFGELLLRVMMIAVVCVLVANQWLRRPAIDSLLFAVARAVGLSPELLPAIVSVLLARSTRELAQDGVLVRRLEAIATDRVDAGQLARPQRWDVRRVRRFMLAFGLTSSLFDLLTFAVLLGVFAADEPVFRTAWFVVSLLTELAVVLVLRTSGAAWRSRPSPLLLAATLAASAVALALPWSGPLAALFGFVPLPATLTAALLAIVLAYVAISEGTKRWLSGARRT